MYLPLYVNDMPIAMKDRSMTNKVKDQHNNELELKNLGATKWILVKEI